MTYFTKATIRGMIQDHPRASRVFTRNALDFVNKQKSPDDQQIIKAQSKAINLVFEIMKEESGWVHKIEKKKINMTKIICRASTNPQKKLHDYYLFHPFAKRDTCTKDNIINRSNKILVNNLDAVINGVRDDHIAYYEGQPPKGKSRRDLKNNFYRALIVFNAIRPNDGSLESAARTTQTYIETYSENLLSSSLVSQK